MKRRPKPSVGLFFFQFKAQNYGMSEPIIHSFFDERTNTVSYLVADPATKQAVVIDPVLNYDHKSGEASVASADAILRKAAQEKLHIAMVLETHVHADHLSGALYIKLKTGAKVAIGEHIKDVQQIFRPIFKVGNLNVEVIATPGHTPACISYKIGDAVFVGDTLFMPDYGTARADFPGGDARQLYRSIHRLLSLPPETRLFMCHDYLPKEGRDKFVWESTVAEERAANVHVHAGVSEEEYVIMRQARDKTLSAPTLLLPSIQVNMRAGKLPPADSNGVQYIKVPVKLLPAAA
jgi:glyoxylase-like metal-dependent hydrolase (beta-lactamase superfamily II)